MTTFAFAKNDGNAERLLKKDFLKVADCNISANVKTYDQGGTLLSNITYKTTGSGSECDGATDGLVLINTKRVVEGITAP
ncbi:hypothetical protein [Halpernia frigidisoli]|uniref:Uncharacterized protein n=1 Tax=Halpernia frigidisoli TaxID=1125876 RepID=A0A1I3DAY9_9FLAO|nr:hypothetical protein [Halpernia frigidisoli]SFH83806.1 hypothetical protein SAMN05443292_0351 [Halpernia frigidisoli]